MLLHAASPEHTLQALPSYDLPLTYDVMVEELEVEALDDWWLDLGYVDLPVFSAV